MFNSRCGKRDVQFIGKRADVLESESNWPEMRPKPIEHSQLWAKCVVRWESTGCGPSSTVFRRIRPKLASICLEVAKITSELVNFGQTMAKGDPESTRIRPSSTQFGPMAAAAARAALKAHGAKAAGAASGCATAAPVPTGVPTSGSTARLVVAPIDPRTALSLPSSSFLPPCPRLGASPLACALPRLRGSNAVRRSWHVGAKPKQRALVGGCCSRGVAAGQG